MSLYSFTTLYSFQWLPHYTCVSGLHSLLHLYHFKHIPCSYHHSTPSSLAAVRYDKPTSTAALDLVLSSIRTSLPSSILTLGLLSHSIRTQLTSWLLSELPGIACLMLSSLFLDKSSANLSPRSVRLLVWKTFTGTPRP